MSSTNWLKRPSGFLLTFFFRFVLHFAFFSLFYWIIWWCKHINIRRIMLCFGMFNWSISFFFRRDWRFNTESFDRSNQNRQKFSKFQKKSIAEQLGITLHLNFPHIHITIQYKIRYGQLNHSIALLTFVIWSHKTFKIQ